MRPIQRNYHVSLGFNEHPDLHLTLAYFRGKTAAGLADLIQLTWDYTAPYDPTAFTIATRVEGWFGYNNTVRALEVVQELPQWVYDLQRELDPESRKWIPHVTCEDEEIDVVADRIGVWHKQNPVAEWELAIYAGD